MTFLLRFSELPIYLKCAYIFAVILIICQILCLSALLYWQIFEPTNLTFKAWLKAPLHLDFFDNTTTAVVISVILWIAQIVGLFLYISWMFHQGKKIYYLVFAFVIVGIWTYFLLPALILLALMLPEASIHHFGLLSFEDLF